MLKTIALTISLIVGSFHARASNELSVYELLKFGDEISLLNYLWEDARSERVHADLLWVRRPMSKTDPFKVPGLIRYEYDFEIQRKIPPTKRSIVAIDPFWGLKRVGAKLAWERGFTGKGVVVAVLDSGVNLVHRALKGNIWQNKGEVHGIKGVDDDGNGFVDDTHGYNFIDETRLPMDDNDHGSHVAGIIASNGRYVSGVAKNATIMAIKTHSYHGISSLFIVSKAILYAADNGAHIINCSWSGHPEAGKYSELMFETFMYAEKKGILIVASAGNDGRNIDHIPAYPASYRLPNLVAVGATNPFDNIAGYSNYGVNSVHVAAPGSAIYSTDSKGGLSKLSGTSMAAPHVSGMAAIIYEKLLLDGRTINPSYVKDQIMDGAEITDSTKSKLKTGIASFRFLEKK